VDASSASGRLRETVRGVPARATGGVFATVTCTSRVDAWVASRTVTVAVYVPTTSVVNPVAAVEVADSAATLPAGAASDHSYVSGSPSGSLEDEASSATDARFAALRSPPARATGGAFGAHRRARVQFLAQQSPSAAQTSPSSRQVPAAQTRDLQSRPGAQSGVVAHAPPVSLPMQKPWKHVRVQQSAFVSQVESTPLQTGGVPKAPSLPSPAQAASTRPTTNAEPSFRIPEASPRDDVARPGRKRTGSRGAAGCRFCSHPFPPGGRERRDTMDAMPLVPFARMTLRSALQPDEVTGRLRALVGPEGTSAPLHGAVKRGPFRLRHGSGHKRIGTVVAGDIERTVGGSKVRLRLRPDSTGWIVLAAGLMGSLSAVCVPRPIDAEDVGVLLTGFAGLYALVIGVFSYHVRKVRTLLVASLEAAEAPARGGGAVPSRALTKRR
jgi:hypothetical protein